MFVRLVRQSLTRSPRRKLLTVAAVALASAIATAQLAALLDIEDRVSRELRSFGANLLISPKAAELRVEIAGVDYRPVTAGAFIPEEALPRLKATFWRNNITAFAPFLPATADVGGQRTVVEGTWFRRVYRAPGGETLRTGVRDLNPTWRVDGSWIDDNDADPMAREALLGSALARRLGLAAGASLSLFGEPFLVRGLLETGGEEENRIFTRLETVQHATGRPGQVARIQLGALTKPEDDFARKDPKKMTPQEYDRWYCTPYLSAIAHQIEEQIPAAAARPIRQVADNEGRVLARVKRLMLLVSLAAMLAAAMLIWSAMATTVVERRAEIAVMKAVGAQNGLIAALFAVEAAVQGALGGALGAAAGVLAARSVSLQVFGAMLETPPLLGPVVILAAVAAALAGAAVPMRAALRFEIAPVLKEAA